VPALVALLHEEATLAMPPLPLWLRGAQNIGASIAAMVLTPNASGLFRLLPTEANGLPAFAAYRKNATEGFEPFALHLLELDGDRVGAITAFLDPRVLRDFALPNRLD
jgi:RNA polymerase sigma-70 factor (ECF subfamily)